MARALHVFFNQHRIAAKAVDGFAFAADQSSSEVFGLLNHAHAFATAARTGLDQGRITDAVGFALQQTGVLVSTVVTRHERHSGRFHQSLGFGLEAHGQNRRGGRADEHQTRCGAGLGKVFVLAQKAIARVHRLGTCGLGGLQNPLPAQVAVFRCAAADVHRFTAGLHMLGPGVGVRINGHGLDAHFAGSGNNAAGNFATVGDQDFGKHSSLLSY